MVNRTLQAKIFKQRRRGKSKPWSQARVQSYKPTKAEVVDYLNLQHRHVRPAVSGHVITPTLYTMAQAKGQNAMPRPLALIAGYRMSRVLRDIPDPAFNVTLHEDMVHKYLMLTNRACNAFVLVEVMFDIRFARASIKYPSRDNLFDAYQRNQIRWMYFEKLYEPPPDGEELIDSQQS